MTARFTLPKLSFAHSALEPAISAATFKEHHGGHHKGYVDKLNKLAAEEGHEASSLVEIVRDTADAAADEVSGLVASDELFVNAAQHFNHCFFWASLSPDGGEPEDDLLEAIERDFGSVDALKEEMVEAGAGHFASGWVWLVWDGEALSVMDTHDSQTPVIDKGLKPLLVIDLWEHAYYLDYQKERKAYLEAITARHLNWAFAAEALAADSVDELGIGIGNGAIESA